MEKIKKYLLFIFLLENIAVQTTLAGAVANPLFYLFLALGAIFVLQGELWNNESRQTYWPICALAAIYVIYQFSFGSTYITQRSIIYLVAKLTTFAIIITGVKNNYEFYKNRMLNALAIFMCFFIIYGFATGGAVDRGSGRMLVGFTNENTTSSMGALVVGTMLFTVREWNLKNVLIACIGLYALLAGGSRAGVLILGILVFMRYGFSPKMLFAALLLYVVSVYVFPSIGLNTIGVQRMVDTVEGVEGANRDIERQACWMMIDEHPISGWGFEAQNQGSAATLSEMGSHNGYLETLKFMGYPMGGLWIAIVTYAILHAIIFYRRNRIPFDMHIAILVAFYAKAFYEGLYVGVHEFGTNLIFVCLAVVYAKINRIKENRL